MATAEDLVGKLVVTPVNRLKRRLDKLPTASVDSTEDMRLFAEACTLEDSGNLVPVDAEEVVKEFSLAHCLHSGLPSTRLAGKSPSHL
ncbi:hypothetical protein ElyMa_001204700 [Elysia marginata]|uniref:Uncharacterized protein n=1 Tax=Elysia marginata TaxID=1093978 RepID=A0AAV4IAB4_9GAST|nr:hypothetical protein ElyMa_001204700 [Elysia marginata]